MINFHDTLAIIKYATSIGLSTRIVTNAFWANSLDKAIEILTLLVDAGLKEINFSTGDEHRKWVHVENVINASLASVKLGLKPLINIEAHDKCDTAKLKWIESNSDFFNEVANGSIRIERGLWMSFKSPQEQSISYNDLSTFIPPQRCSSLFSIIPINPYGEVMACCGLVSERIPFFRLGNINDQPIKKIYEKSFCDLLKLWLFVDGPSKVIRFIYERQNKTFVCKPRHICDYCRSIFLDEANLTILNAHYDEIATSVLLKYNLFTSHSRNHE